MSQIIRNDNAVDTRKNYGSEIAVRILIASLDRTRTGILILPKYHDKVNEITK